MVKAGNKAMVPRLRFPEFQHEGDWTTVKLGAVATISTEKVGNNICVPMSITSGVGLVSQEDKFGRVIAGDSYKSYLLLKPNDFAYNKSATKEFPEGFLTLYSGTEAGCGSEQYIHLLSDQRRVAKYAVSELSILRQPARALAAQVHSGWGSGAWFVECQ